MDIKNHKFEIGQCYLSNSQPQAQILILGQDNVCEYVIFIGIYFKTNDMIYTISFIPIHKDVLLDSINWDMSVINGTTNVETTNSMKKTWLDYHSDGTKTFWTLSVEKIIECIMSMYNSTKYQDSIDENLKNKKIVHIPAAFPTISDGINKE